MVLAILAVMAAPLHRLFLHVPGDSNEGWNAYHAAMALAGGVLYPPMDSFISTNYPPLSFYLVGWAGRWLGDDIVAGRLISLAGLLMVAFNVFCLSRLLGGGRFFAAFSALLFLLYIGIHASAYVAMDDPQWLGHAFATYGALLFFEARTSARPAAMMLLSSLCCVSAVLIKQNLIVLPLALFVWSLFYDRRLLGVWTAASLLLGVAALFAGTAVFGPSMIQGIFLHQRVMSVHILESNVGRFIMPLTPLGVYAALLVGTARRDRSVGFALAYAVIAGGLALFFLTGRGCDVNIVFDLVLALCICAGLAGERAARAQAGGARSWAPAAIALVIASVCLPSFGAALEDAAESIREDRSQLRDYDALVAQLAASQGPVACEMPSLCYWAGRDFDIDAHNYLQKIQKGKVAPDVLKRRIDTGYYAYIQANAPVGRSGLPTETMFGEELSRDVEAHYVVVRRVGDQVLLAPRH